MRTRISDDCYVGVFQPFSVTFELEDEEDLLQMFHVANLTSSGLQRSKTSTNVPLPESRFLYLSKALAGKCMAEIERLGLINIDSDTPTADRDLDGTDDKQEETTDSCEWLGWKGRLMKPGMYQIRGVGYSERDYFITIGMNNLVMCSWTDTQFPLNSFRGGTDSMEYRILKQF